MFKILHGKTTTELEEKVAEYDVTVLGSLAILNGMFFMSLLGEKKVKPKVTKEPEVTEVTKEPTVKPKAKRKSRAKPKPKPKTKETKEKKDD